VSDDKIKPSGDDDDLELTSVLDPDFDPTQLEGGDFDFEIDDLLGEEEGSPAIETISMEDPDDQTLEDDFDISDIALDDTILLDEDSPEVDEVEEDFDFELLEVIETPAGAKPAEAESSRHEDDLFKFDTIDATLREMKDLDAISDDLAENDVFDTDDLLGDSILEEQPADVLEIPGETDLNPEEDLAMFEAPAASPEIKPEEEFEAEEAVIGPVETLDEPAEEAEDILPELWGEESPRPEEPPLMESRPEPQLELQSVLDQDRIETIVRETVRDTVAGILEKMLPEIIEDVVSRELEKIMAELEES